jgi:hypothetical protein
MKHFLLSFAALFLLGSEVRAQGLLSTMNDNPQPGEFRLSEEEFGSTYGFNDTAQAVIRLYYRKWNAGRRIMYIAGIPAGPVVAVGRHYETGPYGVGVNYQKYYYDPWVAPVTYSLLAGSAFGLIKATKWNRRHLYQAIRAYRATHRLPAQVTPALLAASLAY